ncbi:MAG: hypothetical protein KDN20_07865 [Verrucomicrobiae bacterium]|nr:hypothetical protein [Verrucomicrobiae bacterium]
MSVVLSSILPVASPFGVFVWILLLSLGALGIVLSFTKRWGRSRWPFHVVITTAMVSLAFGSLQNPMHGDSHSFGLLSLGLAAFAAARALIATFKEPGPRF